MGIIENTIKQMERIYKQEGRIEGRIEEREKIKIKLQESGIEPEIIEKVIIEEKNIEKIKILKNKELL